MPLPSVEAASREGAIAAARERYGSSVRIVGIRRVRTGGVMGFFTTERFVAEVEEAPAPAPVVERRPASKAESMARIEAALRRDPVLPDPVDEVADLFDGGAGQPAVGLYSRSSAPRAARSAGARGFRTTAAPAAPAAAAAAPAASAPAPAPAPPADDVALPPSPFTAALAQMVARDVDVREAVDEAIAAVSAAAPAPAPPAAPAPAPAPVWEAELPPPAVPPVPAAVPPAAPVVCQPVAVPPAAPVVSQPAAAVVPPAPEPDPVPEWVHEPDFSTGPITSREEAIAEVLRAALAHDTSEAALTQLLRGCAASSPVPQPSRTPGRPTRGARPSRRRTPPRSRCG